jgi:hypothetical protein
MIPQRLISLSLSLSPDILPTFRKSVVIMSGMMDTKVQDDWTNREFIELIAANVKRIADFLNKFGTSF